MNANLHSKCRYLIEESDRMMKAGALYSAYHYLGEAWAALKSLSEEQRKAFRQQIQARWPSHAASSQVLQEARDSLGAVDGMLYSDHPLDSEETLLLVGTRYTIHLLSWLWVEAYHQSFELDLSDVDARIKRQCSRSSMTPAANRMYHAVYN